jgi:GNAT superfamily N-acetyltransferase
MSPVRRLRTTIAYFSRESTAVLCSGSPSHLAESGAGQKAGRLAQSDLSPAISSRPALIHSIGAICVIKTTEETNFSLWSASIEADMKLDLHKLTAASEINSADLLARARRYIPGNEVRLSYLVRMLGEEVAFLSYDAFPDSDRLILYEMFVAERFRGQGIGSELICRSLQLATELGYRRLFVIPKPLAEGITQQKLVRWYEERGFVPDPEQHGAYIMEIRHEGFPNSWITN